MKKSVSEGFEHIVWPYRLAVPLLFLIGAYVQAKKLVYRLVCGPECKPNTNVWLVDGLSIHSRQVRDGAARWPSLNVVYNFTKGEGSCWCIRKIDDYWMHIRNAQAVRNRLKIVKRELAGSVQLVGSQKRRGEPVQILSLAAGSGQAVVEVVAEMRVRGIACTVLLIDQDETAIAYALGLAEQYGLADCVETRCADVIYFDRELEFKPDIIEMCGLMDYLPDALAVRLIKKIHKHLVREGYFLTCHIHPNSERYFLWHVVNWAMLYRTRGDLRRLLTKGKFLDAKLYAEPHRIHSVAVAQKR